MLKKRLPGFILGPTFPHPAFVVVAVAVAVVVVVVVAVAVAVVVVVVGGGVVVGVVVAVAVAVAVVVVVVVVVVVGIESFSTTHKTTKNNVLPQFHQVFTLISPPKTHQRPGQTENDMCFFETPHDDRSIVAFPFFWYTRCWHIYTD